VGLIAGLVEHHLLLGLVLVGGVGAVRTTLSETGRSYLSWKASTYAKQARVWTEADIDQTIKRLHRADRLMKSGTQDRAVFIELLLALEQDRCAC